MKRVMFAVSALSVLMLFFVGVFGFAAGEAEAEMEGPAELTEPVTIRLWHLQAGPLGEALEAMVEDFNAQHELVTVIPEFQGGGSQLHQNVMAAVAAGDPPALAQAGTAEMATYMAEEVIVPVENYFSGPNGLSKAERDDIVEASLQAASLPVEGEELIVGWPTNISLSVLYYNPEILDANDLDVPATWNDFGRAVNAISQNPETWGYTWTPGVTEFIMMLRSRGGELFSEDYSEVRFNSDHGVAALETLVNLTSNDRTLLTSGYDWQYELINERAAMATSTVVSKVYIERDLGDRFPLGMAVAPQGENPNTVLWGRSLVMFETSPEEQQAAWEFLKWYGEPEQVARWSLTSNYLPTRYSAIDLPEMQAALEDDPRMQVGYDSLRIARPEPTIAAWTQIRGMVDEAVNAAVLGEMTPQEALEDAATKAERVLTMGM